MWKTTAVAGQNFFFFFISSYQLSPKPKCSWIQPCACSVIDRCFVEAVWNQAGVWYRPYIKAVAATPPGDDFEALFKSSLRARLSEAWRAPLNPKFRRCSAETQNFTTFVHSDWISMRGESQTKVTLRSELPQCMYLYNLFFPVVEFDKQNLNFSKTTDLWPCFCGETSDALSKHGRWFYIYSNKALMHVKTLLFHRLWLFICLFSLLWPSKCAASHCGNRK